MGRKNKETTLDIRKLVVKLKKEGKSLKYISELINRPKSTVQYIIRRYNISGSLKNKKRSGAPRSLNQTEIRSIVRQVIKNPSLTAVSIAKEKTLSGRKVSVQIIKRYLRENRLCSRVPRIKPLISEINQKKRLSFAKMHQKKTLDFWKNVLFTDETKICVSECSKSQRVWRKKNQALLRKNIQTSIKGNRGSVMVWGCMSAAGTGNLAFIESTMTAQGYLKILKENIPASVGKLQLQTPWTFQQDNDPKHIAGISRLWLVYNTPKQLNHPPQSPDLNPIEHLWHHLKKQLRKRDIQNVHTLKTAIIDEWNKIDPVITQNPVESMPNRLEAVIKAKGAQTKY